MTDRRIENFPPVAFETEEFKEAATEIDDRAIDQREQQDKEAEHYGGDRQPVFDGYADRLPNYQRDVHMVRIF